MDKPITKRRARDRPDQRGQGLIEYAILLVMVALVVVAALYLMGPQIQEAFRVAQAGSVARNPTPMGPSSSTPEDWESTPTPMERITPTPTSDDYRRRRKWPFFDGFRAGAGRWQEIVGRRWRAEDGHYCAGPGGEHRSFTGDEKWTDYTVNVDANLAQGNGYGVYFRATDWDHADSYIFQYDPGYGRGAFLFRKVVNGREQPPFARVWAPKGFDWHNVERQITVVVKGDTFTAYVDGKQVLQARDSTYSHGGVGLRTWDGSDAWFDNFRVGPAGDTE